jgi:hypothetical protein
MAIMRLLTAVAVLSAFLGCGESNENVNDNSDTTVRAGQETWLVEGEPYVEIGYYYEQVFQPLVKNGDCPVGWGIAGGIWTMPALRTKGIASRATVECSLTMASGEEVAKVKAAEQNFFLSLDGFLEVTAFPISVSHAKPNDDDPIDDLYGQNADLWCKVTDAQGGSNESKLSVVIVKGLLSKD